MSHTSLVFPVAALFAASLLPGQIWAEAGDAGELTGTAQQPVGAGNLSQIAGSIGANDVDVYLIQISDVTTFQASTVGTAAFDTRLYLFDQDGKPVTFNDDQSGTVAQSRITGQHLKANGRYYLAIARAAKTPSAVAGPLWDPAGSATAERRGDGAGRNEELAFWLGSTPAGGAYAIQLTGVTFPAQQALAPGTHNLSETSSQTAGSYDYWRASTTGHFQTVHEGVHFTNKGVNGPITVTRVQMRGEDTEQNRGGQVYNNVSVRLANTTVSGNTLNPTFATNLNPATTTVGPTAIIANKQIKRSAGLCPNNYVVDIDLNALGIPFTFDPTGPRPNLIVDISWTNSGPGPNATLTVPIQTASGGPTIVRARGLTSPSATATTGTLIDPPVINFEFVGSPGGEDVLIPARVESFGAPCGASASTIYQLFPHTQWFDLADDPLVRGITLTPDVYPNPTRYTVTLGAPAVDLTKLNPAPNTTTEDAVVTHVLPAPFSFPGGSTTTIRVDDNGFIRFGAAAIASPWDPTLAKFLGTSGEGPIFAPFWHDFSCGRNTATNPNSGLHVRTDGMDVYATWNQVGRFNTEPVPGGQSVSTMQAVVKTGTGVLEIRYGAMDQLTGNTDGGSVTGIVGFSRGNILGVPSVDPGSTDFSRELPRTTGLETAGPGALRLSAVNVVPTVPPHMGGRMFANQQIRWNATNVPAGTVFGLQLIDLLATRPGLAIPGITAPGCVLSTGLSPVIHESFVLPGSTVNGTIPFTVPPGFDGTKLTAQFGAVAFPPGGGIQLTLSNPLLHTIGKQ